MPHLHASRFVLHRFNGDEVYGIKSAVMKAYATDDGVALWFEVEADREGAQRCEDSAEIGRWPKADVGIDLPELNADALAGQEFSIPGTTTDDEDSCMSLLLYCEHQALRQNRIAVLSRNGDHFRLRWTAVTEDVIEPYAGLPQVQVEIDGEFHFKGVAEWDRT